MALSPERVRLTVAIGIFSVLGGAIYWVTRFPIPPRRPRVPQAVQGPRTSYPTSIEGVVLGGDGKPARADVSLVTEATPQPMRGGPVRGRRAAVTRTADDGTFTLGSVNAGRYVLVARSVPSGTSADDTSDAASSWAAAAVETTVAGTTRTKLTMRKGGGLAGQITLNPIRRLRSTEALSANAISNTTVSIEPADVDAKATLLDGAPHISPRPDGRFMISDVPPGRYRLSVTVPAPWIVDVVSAGGRDELDRPIKIDAGAVVNDVTISVIDTPNVLTGEARDVAGHPAPFALVVAFGGEADGRTTARRTQATRADRQGRFTITGLPSGSYTVGLAPPETPETWYSTEFFARLAKDARAVQLTAGIPGVTLVTGARK